MMPGTSSNWEAHHRAGVGSAAATAERAPSGAPPPVGLRAAAPQGQAEPMPDPGLLQLALELHERGEAFALVTVVRAVAPTSAYAGAQAIVCADGAVHGWIGGGCAQRVVVEAARAAIELGAPRLVRIANDASDAVLEVERHRMPCASNGEVELFIHPQATAPRLLILGSTPVAAAARRFARELGFAVTAPGDGAPPLLALVATQGEGDEAALELALASAAQRVLFVASARKAKVIRAALRARGVAAERLAQLEAPAGPDIGARTPAEIALAVISAAVAWRRTGRGAGASAPHAPSRAQAPSAPLAPAADAAARSPACYVNPVCGMAVDPAQARHTLMHDGQSFYFCCDGCRDEFARSPAKYAALQAAARARGDRS
jgi:xanthine dehydrogenase accessory factor